MDKKKQLAYLEYTFIFEPADTFQSGSKFERDLVLFFASKGLEAEVVETVGNASRRVLQICKMDTKLEFTAPKMKGVQETLKTMPMPTGKKRK